MTVDQYAAVELNFDLGGQQLQQWSAENDFNLTDNLAKQYEPLEVRVARVLLQASMYMYMHTNAYLHITLMCAYLSLLLTHCLLHLRR